MRTSLGSLANAVSWRELLVSREQSLGILPGFWGMKATGRASEGPAESSRHH